jgi:hypothetical protein
MKLGTSENVNTIQPGFACVHALYQNACSILNRIFPCPVGTIWASFIREETESKYRA